MNKKSLIDLWIDDWIRRQLISKQLSVSEAPLVQCFSVWFDLIYFQLPIIGWLCYQLLISWLIQTASFLTSRETASRTVHVINAYSNIFSLDFHNIICELGFRKCSSSIQCIPEIYWCNGKVDCKDHSDEAYCRKFPCRVQCFTLPFFLFDLWVSLNNILSLLLKLTCELMLRELDEM